MGIGPPCFDNHFGLICKKIISYFQNSDKSNKLHDQDCIAL